MSKSIELETCAVKESPPDRPTSVAVQEEVFVVLNSYAEKTVYRQNRCSCKSLNLTLNRVKSFKSSTSWIPNVGRIGGPKIIIRLCLNCDR